MDEKAMYPLIKKQLETLGFDVKAEVSNADVVAMKSGMALVVEMKRSLTTALMHQGIMRSSVADAVYLAVFTPTDRVLKSRSFNEKKAIVKQLGLGLMLVDVPREHVTFVIDPASETQGKNTRQRRKLIDEFKLRKTALNVGGVTRTKIITAYRELALRILDALENGPKPIKTLVELTGSMKTTRVLQDNHYGWFERVERGVYQMSSEGKKARHTYADVLDTLRTL